jgi:hypothetical protein
MRQFYLFSAFFLLMHMVVAQQQKSFNMSEFMGSNTNVTAYDYGFLNDLSNAVKWIREYHSWAHYEAANNHFKWDNITTYPHTYTWPDHNKFMDLCKHLGVEVLIDVLNKPSWAGSGHIPNHTGDGSKASDYLEKLEFIGQLVARYGSQKIDPLKLKTADKKSGLNMIQYYEDDNEPDYWWWSPRWPAENYARYCNAVHDGTGVETSAEYPLLGIKSVDPNAKHVMAGLAVKDTLYLHKILEASNGRVPFDILNLHMYCTDQAKGYSPENEQYGFEKGFKDFFEWKKKRLPHIPVWITEFGWDTYINSDKKHSYIYAPIEQQANYLLRSYFILLKMGFEKAFMFMATDGNSQDITQYSASGIFMDRSTGYQKKPSYYYMATMQNILGNSIFKETVAYAERKGDQEVYCYEFEDQSDHAKIYVLWTRRVNSDVDSGATLDYQLDLGYQPETVFSVSPKHLKVNGDTLSVEVNGKAVNLHLTETPQFVVVTGNSTGIRLPVKRNSYLNVYPNPSDGIINLSYAGPSGSLVSLTLHNTSGQWIENITVDQDFAGTMHYRLGKAYSSGIYLVKARTTLGNDIQKIVLMK